LSYLIDTNVLSELRRKTPDSAVIAWFADRPAQSLYLSVLTLGEIRKGIATVKDSRKQPALTDWLELELPRFFHDRVLPVDAIVAHRWGKLLAAAGRPLPVVDSLLAATALSHDLTLVTRNTRDFEHTGVSLINPFSVNT
jgi:toxin FitB